MTIDTLSRTEVLERIKDMIRANGIGLKWCYRWNPELPGVGELVQLDQTDIIAERIANEIMQEAGANDD